MGLPIQQMPRLPAPVSSPATPGLSYRHSRHSGTDLLVDRLYASRSPIFVVYAGLACILQLSLADDLVVYRAAADHHEDPCLLPGRHIWGTYKVHPLRSWSIQRSYEIMKNRELVSGFSLTLSPICAFGAMLHAAVVHRV